MKCPDCREPLEIEATKCRCGWKAAMTPGRVAHSDKPVVHCATVGCEQPAFSRVGDRNLCQACADRVRHEEADAFCRSKGLDTVEKKRAFCKRLAHSFGRGTGGGFAKWAETITQAGIDRLVLMGGKPDEQALDRFRAMGVIDGRNRLIPHEARAVAADAYRADRAREICKVEEDLRRLAEKYPQTETAEGTP